MVRSRWPESLPRDVHLAFYYSGLWAKFPVLWGPECRSPLANRGRDTLSLPSRASVTFIQTTDQPHRRPRSIRPHSFDRPAKIKRPKRSTGNLRALSGASLAPHLSRLISHPHLTPASFDPLIVGMDRGRHKKPSRRSERTTGGSDFKSHRPPNRMHGGGVVVGVT